MLLGIRNEATHVKVTTALTTEELDTSAPRSKTLALVPVLLSRIPLAMAEKRHMHRRMMKFTMTLKLVSFSIALVVQVAIVDADHLFCAS